MFLEQVPLAVTGSHFPEVAVLLWLDSLVSVNTEDEMQLPPVPQKEHGNSLVSHIYASNLGGSKSSCDVSSGPQAYPPNQSHSSAANESTKSIKMKEHLK